MMYVPMQNQSARTTAAAAQGPAETPSSSVGCNVYAAGLPPDMTDQQLYDLFSPYGNISSARIMRAKVTRASKGYGFVLFEDVDAASKAVNALNGLIINGLRIQTRLAHPDASSTLRKFPKRPASAASSTDHSAAPTPMFHSLSTPLTLPMMAAAPSVSMHPSAIVPTNYSFATAAPQTAYQPMFAAGIPGFTAAPNLSPSGAAPSLTPVLANSLAINGAMPGMTAFNPQPMMLHQEPVYIFMVNQDSQQRGNYPM